MSLAAAQTIAGSGLASINAQLALVAHNVANASTPGYVTEAITPRALNAAGVGMGVVAGPATRADDPALRSAVLQQGAGVAGLQTTATALSALDAANGTPGQGNDLPSLLGSLQDAFSTLLNDPANATQQGRVVDAASTLAQGINSRAGTITAQRQTAQDGIVSAVGAVNTALGSIGSLSTRIMSARAAGQSSADLESQRDARLDDLSQLLDITVLPQGNGDMLITTASGVQLPIHGPAAPLSTTGASVQPGAFYPGGGLAPVMLGGTDVTAALQGGQLGADIALRDTTLPTAQAELDEFAQNLAWRFAAQGLSLFTDATGTVPASTGPHVQSGYVGFAALIQASPAAQANPALVRDGTTVITGSPLGPSPFTPNPAAGPAGFATLITRVLSFTFGAQAQTGVGQPVSATAGLGPTGTLAAPYAPPPTLAGIAGALTGALATAAGAANAQLDTEQAVQATLQTRLTSETGVSLDAEMAHMIALQNAYGANAKVMTAVQAMFTQLLGTVAVR